MKKEGLLLNFCTWVWRLMKLNFLWGVFTIMGGIVFGIMPSTVSTFFILRRWIKGDVDTPIIKTYISVYKKEFIKSNKCGAFFLAVFIFLIFDLHILYQIEHTYSTVLYVLVSTVLFFVTVAFIYFFPTYVHFESSAKGYIKNSFIIALTSPMQTILIVLGISILVFFVKSNPGLIAFFAIVVPSYWIMHVLYKRFKQFAISN